MKIKIILKNKKQKKYNKTQKKGKTRKQDKTRNKKCKKDKTRKTRNKKCKKDKTRKHKKGGGDKGEKRPLDEEQSQPSELFSQLTKSSQGSQQSQPEFSSSRHAADRRNRLPQLGLWPGRRAGDS